MKSVYSSILLSCLLCFTTHVTHTTENSESAQEEIMSIEQLEQFFAEHAQNTPAITFVFAFVIQNPDEVNTHNWTDMLTAAHNLTSLLEKTATQSSIALLLPGVSVLEQYKLQDNDNVEGMLSLHLLDESILEEDAQPATHLPDTPSSVQYTHIENTDCIMISFSLKKSENTDPQTWADVLKIAYTFMAVMENFEGQTSVTEAMTPFLFALEDMQKEDTSIAGKIEILA